MRLLNVRVAAAIVRVTARGQFSRYGGPAVSTTDRFESELATMAGVDHALAVNSGTSALICALVGAGIGPGDEVLVPAYTWISSAAAPIAVGAVPVLVDIDESLTIDPVALDAACGERTKAVIAVHMNNLVCDMDAITAVAAERDLRVVEDACQAVGVTYRGRRVGTIGDVGAFSFNQHKNVTSGEGGAVLTDDPVIAARAAMYHDVGSYIRPREVVGEVPVFIGQNARMPELSSAMLRPQIARIDEQLRRRAHRRRILVEAMESSTSFEGTLVEHRSPDDAVALAVRFDDPATAERFARKRGVTRLIDSGRHVFTNWQPIQERRTHHPNVDPWAGHDVDYSADRYRATLETLERSCTIGVPPQVPATAFRALALDLFR